MFGLFSSSSSDNSSSSSVLGQNNKHVVIVGGGIAGTSTAYFLRKLADSDSSSSKLDITILDRAPKLHDAGASRYNGGIICPSILRHWSSPSFMMTGIKTTVMNIFDWNNPVRKVWVDKRCWVDPDWYRFGAHFLYAGIFEDKANREKMGIISEHATRIWRELLDDKREHSFSADLRNRKKWGGTPEWFKGMIFTNPGAGLRDYLNERASGWQDNENSKRLAGCFDCEEIDGSDVVLKMVPQLRRDYLGEDGRGILFTEKSEGVGDIEKFGVAMAGAIKGLRVKNHEL